MNEQNLILGVRELLSWTKESMHAQCYQENLGSFWAYFIFKMYTVIYLCVSVCAWVSVCACMCVRACVYVHAPAEAEPGCWIP